MKSYWGLEVVISRWKVLYTDSKRLAGDFVPPPLCPKPASRSDEENDRHGHVKQESILEYVGKDLHPNGSVISTSWSSLGLSAYGTWGSVDTLMEFIELWTH